MKTLELPLGRDHRRRCRSKPHSLVSARDLISLVAAFTLAASIFGAQSRAAETTNQPALSHSPASRAAAEPESGGEAGGRSFLWKEVVVSGFYSFPGVKGLPPGDSSRDHWGLSPRPPGTYLGLDYVRTFTASSRVNRILPEWLPLVAMDLHPRVVYDPADYQHGLEPFNVAPQDFWFRFDPGNIDRLQLRLGQFVIPYGAHPLMAPRQSFILPVEAIDLGLKWDWGVDLKGPLGEYDWEIAATTGMGEGLRAPRVFSGPDRRSYLITGRIGSPAYVDLQHGLSFLAGDLPTIMAHTLVDSRAISRWRVSYDAFYKYGTFLMVGGQITFGQDGFAGDEEFVGVTMGQPAEALGYRLWADWVVPQHQNLRLQFQFESMYRDLGTHDANDTAAIWQANYSFTTGISAVLSFRKEFTRAMGDRNDAIYLTFIYYGL